VKEEDPRVDEGTAHALGETLVPQKIEGVLLEFVRTEGLRGILRLKGEASPFITDSNPLYPGRPLLEVSPLEGKGGDPATLKTCRVLNRYFLWAFRELSRHPVNRQRERKGLLPLNALATQRPGMRRPVEPFYERWGLRGLSISSGAIYWGLAEVLGMDCLRVADTGDPSGDLLERLRMGYEAKDYDLVHVHTKALDEAAHTKDPEYKKGVIEELDHGMAYLLEEVAQDPEVLLVITADHSTPSSGRMIHSGETVPLLVVGKHVRRDGVTRFCEVECARGALGPLKGPELMHMVLNLMDRGKLQGLMDSPRDRPYYPGPSRPLRIMGGNGREA